MRPLAFFFLMLLSGLGMQSARSLEPLGSEPIVPLVPVGELDPEKVRLGERLFHDVRLSRDSTVSCATCHNLSRGGADGRGVSEGVGRAKGDINAPTVFNSAYNFRQFWNGRASSLEEQVDGPLQHPKEMGSTWAEVLERLARDAEYPGQFQRAFGDRITRERVKEAIAAFERSLTTLDSPFDRYLRGEAGAITEKERLGYEKFKSYGCVACHQGMNVGGNMFQTMGVTGNYFQDRGTGLTEADLGKYAVTKREEDRHVFRVPSLRNVALTAPYFHDGSAPTLERAVEVMAKYQLGRKLPKADVDAITSFLKTLSGRAPAATTPSGVRP